MRRRTVVTDRSRQRVGPIFKGQAVQEEWLHCRRLEVLELSAVMSVMLFRCVRFVISVCLLLHISSWKKLGSHRTDFHEI
jgi:hypothetical protein